MKLSTKQKLLDNELILSTESIDRAKITYYCHGSLKTIQILLIIATIQVIANILRRKERKKEISQMDSFLINGYVFTIHNKQYFNLISFVTQIITYTYVKLCLMKNKMRNIGRILF